VTVAIDGAEHGASGTPRHPDVYDDHADGVYRTPYAYDHLPALVDWSWVCRTSAGTSPPNTRSGLDLRARRSDVCLGADAE